jgi:hypothetical protein
MLITSTLVGSATIGECAVVIEVSPSTDRASFAPSSPDAGTNVYYTIRK